MINFILAGALYLTGYYGVCNRTGDYCPGHKGQLQLEYVQPITNRLDLSVKVGHESNPLDGAYRHGDRGNEYQMIGIKVRVW